MQGAKGQEGKRDKEEEEIGGDGIDWEAHWAQMIDQADCDAEMLM